MRILLDESLPRELARDLPEQHSEHSTRSTRPLQRLKRPLIEVPPRLVRGSLHDWAGDPEPGDCSRRSCFLRCASMARCSMERTCSGRSFPNRRR